VAVLVIRHAPPPVLRTIGCLQVECWGYAAANVKN
jgi:hypothetical protein